MPTHYNNQMNNQNSFYDRNLALPQSNMYGNPYGFRQHQAQQPQQPASPYNWGAMAQQNTGGSMPATGIPAWRTPPQLTAPTVEAARYGTPTPYQKQGLGMYDYEVLAPLLQNDMTKMGLTTQGLASQNLAKSQNVARQDEWAKTLARQNAISRANLARTGLDTGEHERIQRNLRREGLMGQQNIDRDLEDRMLNIKMQDEDIKRQNTQRLMELSARAAGMEVPIMNQDRLRQSEIANRNEQARIDALNRNRWLQEITKNENLMARWIAEQQERNRRLAAEAEEKRRIENLPIDDRTILHPNRRPGPNIENLPIDDPTILSPDPPRQPLPQPQPAERSKWTEQKNINMISNVIRQDLEAGFSREDILANLLPQSSKDPQYQALVRRLVNDLT